MNLSPTHRQAPVAIPPDQLRLSVAPMMDWTKEFGNR